MRRNPDFIMRNLAGKLVLVPVGKAAKAFPGMITVNPSGKFIWELLEKDMTMEQVVEAMLGNYEVSYETAQADAKGFIDCLKSVKAVIE